MIVRFFNRMGRPIAQTAPKSAARAWRLNEIGQASVSIPRTALEANEDFLLFGNLMAIESEYAPLWAGVILPSRKWDQEYITITAYSGERLLQGRVLPQNMKIDSSAPGSVFQAIIEWIHNTYQPNLDIGTIYKKGQAISREYHFDDAWEAVCELAETADNELWIEPYYDAKHWLRFWGHWYQQRGKDKSGKIALIENVNMGAPTSLNEGGEIINEWIYHSGGNWAADTVAVGRYVDVSEARISGRWTGVQSISEPSNQKQLTEMAEKRVEETRHVEGIFQADCLNVDSLWLKISPGDIIWLQSSTVGWTPEGALGFRGKVKVISCALNEAQGYMPIVIEEVAE